MKSYFIDQDPFFGEEGIEEIALRTDMLPLEWVFQIEPLTSTGQILNRESEGIKGIAPITDRDNSWSSISMEFQQYYRKYLLDKTETELLVN
ncbi:MAG: hypothetical protein KJ737_23900 [Proteobacteria bacterium]|nr:hypothetical protein [Pseudomonadota bacterium]